MNGTFKASSSNSSSARGHSFLAVQLLVTYTVPCCCRCCYFWVAVVAVPAVHLLRCCTISRKVRIVSLLTLVCSSATYVLTLLLLQLHCQQQQQQQQQRQQQQQQQQHLQQLQQQQHCGLEKQSVFLVIRTKQFQHD